MEELIEKAKNGDIKSFTKIIKNMEKDLYRIAYTKLKNNEDISDAIQNTMLMMFKNIKRLRKNEYFKTWTIKILINECNKIIKDNLKRNKLIEKSTIETSDIEVTGSIAVKNKEYEEFLDFNSLISNLNSDEQLIFTLYYKDKFSCEEIAKITKLRIGTIKSKLSRGRNKIEDYLKKEVF